MTVALPDYRSQFYLTRPDEDYQQNRPHLFWGTTSDKSRNAAPDMNRIRSLLIESNLTAKAAPIQGLGPLQRIQKKDAASSGKIFKETVRCMHQEGTLWRKTAELVCIVALTLLIGVGIYLSLSFLLQRYAQMQLGKLFIFNASDTLRLFPIRPYGWIDFIPEALGIIGGLSLVSIFTGVKAHERLTSNNSFYSHYKRLQQAYSDDYLLVQDRVSIHSSLCGRDMNSLANKKEEGGWEDPISGDTIAKEDMLSPSTFLIGTYAMKLENIIKRLFIRNLDAEGRMPHPLENRSLSAAEQAKFLKEVCTFFNLTEDQLLNCWKIDLTAEKVPPYLQEHMNELRIIARLMKFLETLPNEVALNYASKTLLSVHKEMLAAVPLTSLTFLELGDPFFMAFLQEMERREVTEWQVR